MIRRDFLKKAALGALSLSGLHGRELAADVAVIGGTPYHFVKYEARKKCHSNRKKSASPKQVLGDCE